MLIRRHTVTIEIEQRTVRVEQTTHCSEREREHDDTSPAPSAAVPRPAADGKPTVRELPSLNERP